MHFTDHGTRDDSSFSCVASCRSSLQAKLRAAEGLALLRLRRFPEAGTAFTSVAAQLENHWSDVVASQVTEDSRCVCMPMLRALVDSLHEGLVRQGCSLLFGAVAPPGSAWWYERAHLRICRHRCLLCLPALVRRTWPCMAHCARWRPSHARRWSSASRNRWISGKCSSSCRTSARPSSATCSPGDGRAGMTTPCRRSLRLEWRSHASRPC